MRALSGTRGLVAAAASAGVAHTAAFAPIGLWWLQTLSLAILVALAARHPAARGRAGAALAGLAFGFGWFASGVSWLFISMHTYGGMPAPFAVLSLVAFALYLAAFTAASLALAASALRRGADPAAGRAARSTTYGALVFAACWGAGELARGWLFTGFPWLSSGYAHVDGPLAGVAPIAGVHAVGMLAAICSAGIALTGIALANRIQAGSRLVASLTCVVAPLALGLASTQIDWAQEAGEPVRVVLLQGNVPQQMKFDPQRAVEAMRAYVRAAAAQRADLIVLPETAWTVPWSATPEPIAQSLLAALGDSGAVAAIGMPLPVGPDGDWTLLTNSVGAVSRDGALPWRYDKRHLVPFGEFVPAGFRWFVDLMEIPLGDFGRGAALQPALEVRGQHFSFNICYEDLFGDELAPAVRAGASILVNVSNIGWFGRSHALPQHLQISRMRSVELARPMLRATNTGMTAAIDARGRVLAWLPAHAEQSLSVTLRGTTGLTPYARWDTGATLAALALIAAMAAALRPSR